MNHPIDTRVAAELATLGDRGRAASAARFEAWSDAHPTKPCADCFGGSFTEAKDGARRPFDHRDFKPGVDRYEATCPTCRGLGRVFITAAERDAIERERLDTLRAKYAATRADVCKLRGMTPTTFDRIARRHITAANPSPEEWLAGARAVRTIYL